MVVTQCIEEIFDSIEWSRLFQDPSSELKRAFNSSDSHHSLGDEKLLKEVQRTTSMSSENYSEAFYSADEDLNINSRSSSLRNSILSSGDTPLTRHDSSSVPTQRWKLTHISRFHFSLVFPSSEYFYKLNYSFAKNLKSSFYIHRKSCGDNWLTFTDKIRCLVPVIIIVA